MRLTLFLTQYCVWHYGRSIPSFLSIWGNFFWFAYHFFSIPVLLRTLFSPFQKLGEEYKRTTELWPIISTFLVNSIMRCVGAAVRLFVIAAGVAALLLVAAIGLVLFVAWIMLPFIAFTLAVVGIRGAALEFGI